MKKITVTMTEPQARALARFVWEYAPDANLSEEEWTASQQGALDRGYNALVEALPEGDE